MIVDDSGIFRGFWKRILASYEDIEVVATAVNGKEALEIARYHTIDLVLLDVEMPEMDGLSTIPILLSEHASIKIIMVSSHTAKASQITVEALTRGAHDFIEKPKAISNTEDLTRFSNELVLKIRSISNQVKNFNQGVDYFSEDKTSKKIKEDSNLLFNKNIKQPKVIVVGSSTGGPNALGIFVSGLIKDICAPILITQHMPPRFTNILAECLKKKSGKECKEGQHNEYIKNNKIYVAPGDYHMTIKKVSDKFMIELNQDPPENFCRPSVDVMFRSAASIFGSEVLAIVLTGMGEDGKIGCDFIRKAGGTVVAQDEETSVVWGMPGAVCRSGLAHWILPLPKIAEKTLEICSV